MSIDWGSAPDWVAGIGTTLAFGAAGYAGLAAKRQLDHLRRQEEDRALEEHRAHSSRVAIWLEAGIDGQPHVFYSNGSGLPIYAVTVRCRVPWHRVGPHPGMTHTEIPVLGPTDGPRRLHKVEADLRSTTAGVMRHTGSGGFVAIQPDLVGWAPKSLGELVVTDVSAGIAFKDAQGHAWARLADGTLTEHRKLGQAQEAISAGW